MRLRRSLPLGFVVAVGLSVSVSAHADLCSRLPAWAESPCRVLSGWWGGAFGEVSDSLGRGLESATSEDGFGADPWGRSSVQQPPVPPSNEPPSSQEGDPQG